MAGTNPQHQPLASNVIRYDGMTTDVETRSQRDSTNPGPPNSHYVQNTSYSIYWAVTWNNPPTEWKQNIEWLWTKNHAAYIIAGYESGPQMDTPHLQIFVQFVTRKRLVGVRSLFGNNVYATAKYQHTTYAQNVDYCKKGGNWVEFGVPPEDAAAGTQMSEKWNRFINLSRTGQLGLVQSELPDMYTRYFNTMKRLEGEGKMDALIVDLPTPCGVWVWGPPGTGKSTTLRNAYPLAYRKNITKWWDGYAGEKEVIIDDIADYRVMLPHLKTWGDQGWFMGEMKGSSVKMRPNCIIVTSNVSMEEAFPDPVQLRAIEKRFINVPFDRYRKFSEVEMRDITENRTLPDVILARRYVANNYQPTEYGQLADYHEQPGTRELILTGITDNPFQENQFPPLPPRVRGAKYPRDEVVLSRLADDNDAVEQPEEEPEQEPIVVTSPPPEAASSSSAAGLQLLRHDPDITQVIGTRAADMKYVDSKRGSARRGPGDKNARRQAMSDIITYKKRDRDDNDHTLGPAPILNQTDPADEDDPFQPQPPKPKGKGKKDPTW